MRQLTRSGGLARLRGHGPIGVNEADGTAADRLQRPRFSPDPTGLASGGRPPSPSFPARTACVRIRDWPSGERPREKLLARGPAVLSAAGLLAVFLGSGTRGRDAVAGARQLLVDHGPLRTLLERGPAELAKLPGLGPARASRLASALELCDRYLAAGLERGEALTDPKA